jgi:hypothetical protein
MHEFENVGYIDLQKTGTTTIANALAEILDEKEVYRHMHGPIPPRFDRSKLYFISVREPLSLYISLYAFGTGERRGGLFKSLQRQGLERLFRPTLEDFEIWLDFMLDPRNAATLNGPYGDAAPFDAVGFLSVRLLFTSLPRFKERAAKSKLRSRAEVRDMFLKKHVFQDYVRTENLGGDLFAFLQCHAERLKFREPLTTADEFMSRLQMRNSSKKIPGLNRDRVSPELVRRVREREWLFYETFGYDADPSGRPPASVAMAGSGDER